MEAQKKLKDWCKSWWTNGGFVNPWAIYAKSSWGALFQCCLMSQNESKWDLRLEKVRNDQNPLKKSSNWGLCSQCRSISARDSGQKSRRPVWPADVPIIRCALVRPLKLRNEPWDRPEVLEMVGGCCRRCWCHGLPKMRFVEFGWCVCGENSDEVMEDVPRPWDLCPQC